MRAAGLTFLLAAAAGSSVRAAPLAAPPLPQGPPAPVAAPYDPGADAGAAIAAARREAAATGKDLLLDFGANWCPDCRILAGVLRLPAVAPWVAAHFVPVMVDVGRIDRNLGYAAAYGVRITAIPALLVVTPAGVLLDPDGSRALGDARRMSTASMVGLLAEWGGRTRPPA